MAKKYYYVVKLERLGIYLLRSTESESVEGCISYIKEHKEHAKNYINYIIVFMNELDIEEVEEDPDSIYSYELTNSEVYNAVQGY